MASIVVLPKQGNSVESCIIVRWLKNVGDAVKDGDGLCEVETDKATVEVPATAAGTLLAQVRKQGEDVPVQTPLAVIGNAGEDVAIPVAPASAGTDGGLQPAAGEHGHHPPALGPGRLPRRQGPGRRDALSPATAAMRPALAAISPMLPRFNTSQPLGPPFHGSKP